MREGEVRKQYACPTVNHLANFSKRVCVPFMDSGMLFSINERSLCPTCQKIYGSPLNDLLLLFTQSFLLTTDDYISKSRCDCLWTIFRFLFEPVFGEVEMFLIQLISQMAAA